MTHAGQIGDGIYAQVSDGEGSRIDEWSNGIFDETGPANPRVRGPVFLGARAHVAEASVRSVHNRGEIYEFEAPLPPGWYVLVLDGVIAGLTSLPKHGSGKVRFRFDRALADRAAKAFGVERRDRVPLGTGLVGRFVLARSRLTPREPIPLVVELTNLGDETVFAMLGGPVCDLEGAFRNDQRLPICDSFVWDGVVPTPTLGPGETYRSHELSSELLSRVSELAEAGAFRIDCLARVVLRTAEFWERDADEWDFEVRERLTFERLER